MSTPETTQPSVSIEGLSKVFALRGRSGLTGVRGLRSLLRRVPTPRGGESRGKSLRALHDINLTVARGEILGVIGRNGAGKSTLLKVLARVIAPTTGRVLLRGRVGSLLELGVGFSPDMTVRENIHLYGRLGGLRQREIALVEERVLEFANLAQYRDELLASCPGGSFIRLAFAALMNTRADIILADEVLAVGDSKFRRQCEESIVNDTSGQAVLFVSHDMSAIRRICSRVIWIDHGQIVAVGEPEDVVSRYEAQLLQKRVADPREDCRILELRLLGEDRAPVGALQTEAPSFVECVFEVAERRGPVQVAIGLWRGKAHAFTLTCPHLFVADRPTRFRAAIHIPASFLNEATYTAKCSLVASDGAAGAALVQKDSQELEFQVFNADPEQSVWRDWDWGRGGVLAPRLKWSLPGDGAGAGTAQ